MNENKDLIIILSCARRVVPGHLYLCFILVRVQIQSEHEFHWTALVLSSQASFIYFWLIPLSDELSYHLHLFGRFHWVVNALILNFLKFCDFLWWWLIKFLLIYQFYFLEKRSILEGHSLYKIVSGDFLYKIGSNIECSFVKFHINPSSQCELWADLCHMFALPELKKITSCLWFPLISHLYSLWP